MKAKQQTGIWVFVAVVLALILAVAAYFTLIGPELDKASAARENTDLERDANDLLELQIQQMKALEQEVPDWREQIAKVSLDLPPRTEQPELERLIASTLERFDLPMVDMTTTRPSEIDPTSLAGLEPPTIAVEEEPAAEESPSPEPTTEEDDDLSTDGTTGGVAGGTTETPAVEEAAFTGLLGIPVVVTTEGNPEDVLSFLKAMENQLTRFYTVTNLTIEKASPTEEVAGRPELTEEQWVVQITGLVFSLLDDDRSFIDDETRELPEYKAGGSVDNAFEPLPGTEEDAA